MAFSAVGCQKLDSHLNADAMCYGPCTSQSLLCAPQSTAADIAAAQILSVTLIDKNRHHQLTLPHSCVLSIADWTQPVSDCVGWLPQRVYALEG